MTNDPIDLLKRVVGDSQLKADPEAYLKKHKGNYTEALRSIAKDNGLEIDEDQERAMHEAYKLPVINRAYFEENWKSDKEIAALEARGNEIFEKIYKAKAGTLDTKSPLSLYGTGGVKKPASLNEADAAYSAELNTINETLRKNQDLRDFGFNKIEKPAFGQRDLAGVKRDIKDKKLEAAGPVINEEDRPRMESEMDEKEHARYKGTEEARARIKKEADDMELALINEKDDPPVVVSYPTAAKNAAVEVGGSTKNQWVRALGIMKEADYKLTRQTEMAAEAFEADPTEENKAKLDVLIAHGKEQRRQFSMGFGVEETIRNEEEKYRKVAESVYKNESWLDKAGVSAKSAIGRLWHTTLGKGFDDFMGRFNGESLDDFLDRREEQGKAAAPYQSAPGFSGGAIQRYVDVEGQRFHVDQHGDIISPVDNDMNLLDLSDPTKQKALNALADTYNKNKDKYKVQNDFSGSRLFGSGVELVINMLPIIAGTMGTSMIPGVGQLGAIRSGAAFISGFATMFGDDFERSLQAGRGFDHAWNTGVLSSGIKSVFETFGGVEARMGKQLGEGVKDLLIKNTETLIKKYGTQNLPKKFWNEWWGMVKKELPPETVTELAQDFSDAYIDHAVNGMALEIDPLDEVNMVLSMPFGVGGFGLVTTYFKTKKDKDVWKRSYIAAVRSGKQIESVFDESVKEGKLTEEDKGLKVASLNRERDQVSKIVGNLSITDKQVDKVLDMVAEKAMNLEFAAGTKNPVKAEKFRAEADKIQEKIDKVILEYSQQPERIENVRDNYLFNKDYEEGEFDRNINQETPTDGEGQQGDPADAGASTGQPGVATTNTTGTQSSPVPQAVPAGEQLPVLGQTTKVVPYEPRVTFYGVMGDNAVVKNEKGESGVIKVDDGGKVTVEYEGRIEELGNIEELSDETLQDHGLTVEDASAVANRTYKVGNDVFVSDNLDDAIEFDEDGNVASVTLVKVEKGKASKGQVFTGQQAENLAYQITLDKFSNLQSNEGIRTIEALIPEKAGSVPATTTKGKAEAPQPSNAKPTGKAEPVRQKIATAKVVVDGKVKSIKVIVPDLKKTEAEILEMAENGEITHLEALAILQSAFKKNYTNQELNDIVAKSLEKKEESGITETNLEELEHNAEEERDAALSSAEERREDGEFKEDGITYKRNEPSEGIKGKSGEVRFASGVVVPFTYKLVEADNVQPSHQGGVINKGYFIPEGQPKPRTGDDSINAENGFADNPRFNELGHNTNAYSGAPVTNERDEIIQGHNRAAGLKKGYRQGNGKYKSDLINNAEKFGYTKDQVEGMTNPMLVREVKASDEKAIELGNYDVKDLETGGKRRVDPVATSRRIPYDIKAKILKLLFSGSEDVTTTQKIRDNQGSVLKLVFPFLNETQRAALVNKEGKLTGTGVEDIASLVEYFMFDGGHISLPELFDALSHTQKEGLKKAIPFIYSVPIGKGLLHELQAAIIALNVFKSSGLDFNNWLAAADIFNEGMTPVDKYSPAELALVKKLDEAKSQSEIKNIFSEYAKLVNGTDKDMFSEAVKGLSKKEAIKKQFNVTYNERQNKKQNKSGGEVASGQAKTDTNEKPAAPTKTKEEVGLDESAKRKKSKEEFDKISGVKTTLVGSTARNEAKETSDIDIVLEGMPIQGKDKLNSEERAKNSNYAYDTLKHLAENGTITEFELLPNGFGLSFKFNGHTFQVVPNPSAKSPAKTQEEVKEKPKYRWNRIEKRWEEVSTEKPAPAKAGSVGVWKDVFHGTNNHFTEFKAGPKRKLGTFFFVNRGQAEKRGNRVIKARIKADKTYTLDAVRWLAMSDKDAIKLRDKLIEDGYDSVYIPPTDLLDDMYTEGVWVALDTNGIEIETPQAGSGVGGDVEIKNEGKADAPTKESVTERLNINNPFYKKVEDALVKLGLIEKYNAETGTGDVVGGYAQQTSDGGFSVGKMLFSQDGSISYFDGDVKVSFDKNGNVISENTKEAKQKANVLAIESKKESIDSLEKTRDSEAFKYKEVTETDILGNKKKVKRLKTEQELKDSTDKINAAIDKAKAELSNLEQSIKETTKSETPTTNTGVEEGSGVGGDEKFTAKGGNKVVDEKGEPITVYHTTKAKNISEFKTSGEIETLGGKVKNEGAYFTPIKGEYANKGGNEYAVQISIKNPYITTDQIESAIISPEKKADLISKGHDGVILMRNSKPAEYVVFDKSQIKAAEQSLKETTKAETPTTNTGVEAGSVGVGGDVKPIRQLGTGANVYFETEKHRVNDNLKNGKVLLNIGSKESEIPMANIEFDSATEAVNIAKELNRIYPKGVPDAVLIDKVVENIKVAQSLKPEAKKEQSKTEPLPAPDKKAARKIRDEALRAQADEAFKAFRKSLGKNLSSGGLDKDSLEKGIELIGIYIKSGVYKFSDIVEDAVEEFGDVVKEMFNALKVAYTAYYGAATDEEAEKMDVASARKSKFEDIIKTKTDESKTETGTGGAGLDRVPEGVQPGLFQGADQEGDVGGASNEGSGAVQQDGGGTKGQPRLRPGRGRGGGKNVSVSGTKSVEVDLFSPEADRLSSDLFVSKDEPPIIVGTILPSPAPLSNYVPDKEEDTAKSFSKTKHFAKNLKAIKALLAIVKDGDRLATAEEKEMLSDYVGWGGIKAVNRIAGSKLWSNSDLPFKGMYEELVVLIKEFEDLGYVGLMKDISRSTLNAHYTSPDVIRGVYHALSKLGFTGGNILEPSAGIGNFIGYAPKDILDKSSITAIELDKFTGKILEKLYPSVYTKIKGYQDVKIANGSVDLVISNIPFGDYDVTPNKSDSDIAKRAAGRIHNYFFIKAIEQAREGGLVAFITTAGTLDTPGNEFVRTYIKDNTEFVGAIRLPSTAFKVNAGTEVVTDVIFLKKNTDAKSNQDIINTTEVNVPGGSIGINNYFVNNPDHVIGDIKLDFGLHGRKALVVDYDGNDIGKRINDIVDKYFPKNIYAKRDQESIDAETTKIGEERVDHRISIDKDGAFTYVNNERKSIDMGVEKAKAFIDLRDALDRQYKLESSPTATDGMVEQNRAELNRRYDTFVGVFQKLNSPKNIKHILKDKFGYNVLALERVDKESGKTVKADIFKSRGIVSTRKATKASNISDAVSINYNELGAIDVERIASLLGEDSDGLVERYYGDVFYDSDGTVVGREDYLSGNVKKKYKEALALAEGNDLYQQNVDALAEVLPKDIPIENIDINIGQRWVPLAYYKEFADFIFKTRTKIKYDPITDSYAIDGSKVGEASGSWAIGKMDGFELLIHAMHGSSPAIYMSGPTPGSRVIDPVNTQLANEKVEKLGEEFKSWIATSPERAEVLQGLYNDSFNTNVKRRFSDVFTVNGQSYDIILKEHQKRGANMIVANNGGIIDHAVGFGKTFLIIAAALKMRQLGVANKPMIVGLKSTIQDLASDAKKLFPMAKVLSPSEADFSKENRKKLLSTIQNNDWDLIIISHEQFGAIPQDKEFHKGIIEKEIEEIEAALLALEAESGEAASRKLIQGLTKRKENLRAKLDELADFKKDDELLSFKDIGIDHLFVDESQYFKNLAYTTRINRVSGLGNPLGSKRSYNMLVAARTLQAFHGGDKGVTFVSGTPISNSLVEMYLLLKYLRPKRMQELGYTTFDAWVNQFALKNRELEFTVAGGIKEKTRFREFVNVPELSLLYNEVADVRNEHNLTIERPSIRGGKPTLVAVKQSEAQQEWTKRIIQFAEQKQGSRDGTLIGKGSLTKEEQSAAMLMVTTIGNKLSNDIRLVDKKAEFNPEGKLVSVANKVIEEYENSKDIKGTQLIFSDIGTPKTGKVFDDILSYLEDEKNIDFDTINLIFGEPNEETGERATKPVKQIRERIKEYLEYSDTEIDFVFEEAKNSSLNSFNTYNEIKRLLIQKGMPAEEIAFIHDYKNKNKRKALFADVNSGKVRVVIGSTQKLGTGVNVQKRIVAMHHVDAKWTPADMEQRNGRGIRQGNINTEVAVFQYGTEQTVDAYKYQLIATKQRFIDQVKLGALSGTRTIKEDDGENMSAQEFVALLSGNPLLLEKAKLEALIAKLTRSARAFIGEQSRIRSGVLSNERSIPRQEEFIEGRKKDIETASKNMRTDEEGKVVPIWVIDYKQIDDSKVRRELVEEKINSIKNKEIGADVIIGQVAGLNYTARKIEDPSVAQKGGLDFSTIKYELSGDTMVYGTSSVPSNTINAFADNLAKAEKVLADTKKELESYKSALKDNWPKEEELAAAKARLAEVVKELTPEKKKEEEGVNSEEENNFQQTDQKFAPLDVGRFNQLLENLNDAIQGRLGGVLSGSEFDSKVRGMKEIRSGGKVYGFKDANGKVWLNGDEMNANTPNHEYGHVWIDVMEGVRPDIFKKGLEIADKLIYIERLLERKDSVYAKDIAEYKKGNKTGLLKEALAMAIGDHGEQIVNIADKNRFKAWLKAFWNSVKDFFGGKLTDMTPERIQKLTPLEFIELAAGQLVSGDAVEGEMLAPNGKPSNLTPEQYRLVRTPEFKKWFGDSQVKDENGEPLVVYHGTTKYGGVTSFKKGKRGNIGPGIYFTNDKDYAQSYADKYGKGNGHNINVFVKIKNPFYVYGIDGAEALITKLYSKSIYENRARKQSNPNYLVTSADIAKLKSIGYDGIVWAVKEGGEYKEYSVFEPNQIKSAIGNTSFNPESNDIRFQVLPDGRKVQVKPLPDGVEVVNGFYSPLEKVITDSKFDKLPAKQWIEKYANSEEAKWTGLTDWLGQQQGSVSKTDIQQFLKDNRIEIVEVVKGGEVSEAEIDVLLADETGEGMTRDEAREYLSNDEDNNQTKFSQYQLEGEKENYKEVLVTLPKDNGLSWKRNGSGLWAYFIGDKQVSDGVPENTNRYKELARKTINSRNVLDSKKNDFKSSHFDEPNILVHLRMNTRVDAEGNKVLFLEEVQSDWGQKGKKEGFNIPAKKNEFRKEKQMDGSWVVKDANNTAWWHGSTEERADAVINDYNTRETRIPKEVGAIPNAPFVTDTNAWVKLGLKVALKEAVKQGVDKIAWSTGTQQFDRWGSEKIDWVKTPIENYEIRKDSLSGEWVVSIDAMGVNGKNKAILRIGFPTEKEAKDYVNKGSWEVAIKEQVEGTAFAGMNIDEKALSENGISIISKDDLRAAFAKNLKRERNDAEIDKLTDRIWDRMQTEDSGTSLPRKEGMEDFYGKPSDAIRSKSFTIKKEGELFAVKDEKGKTIRTFKQENEANKFKENYGLGIVGNVAKSLFKQEPKTVEIDQSPSFVKEKLEVVYRPNEPMGRVWLVEDNQGRVRGRLSSKEAAEQEKAGMLKQREVAMKSSTQHSIDITQELIAEVNQGLPQFQETGGREPGYVSLTRKAYVKAQRELAAAEERISRMNVTEYTMFGAPKGGSLFGIKGDDIKDIIGPLKEKLAIAKEAYNKALVKAEVEESASKGQMDLFKKEEQIKRSQAEEELREATEEFKSAWKDMSVSRIVLDPWSDAERVKRVVDSLFRLAVAKGIVLKEDILALVKKQLEGISTYRAGKVAATLETYMKAYNNPELDQKLTDIMTAMGLDIPQAITFMELSYNEEGTNKPEILKYLNDLKAKQAEYDAVNEPIEAKSKADFLNKFMHALYAYKEVDTGFYNVDITGVYSGIETNIISHDKKGSVLHAKQFIDSQHDQFKNEHGGSTTQFIQTISDFLQGNTTPVAETISSAALEFIGQLKKTGSVYTGISYYERLMDTIKEHAAERRRALAIALSQGVGVGNNLFSEKLLKIKQFKEQALDDITDEESDEANHERLEDEANYLRGQADPIRRVAPMDRSVSEKAKKKLTEMPAEEVSVLREKVKKCR